MNLSAHAKNCTCQMPLVACLVCGKIGEAYRVFGRSGKLYRRKHFVEGVSGLCPGSDRETPQMSESFRPFFKNVERKSDLELEKIIETR